MSGLWTACVYYLSQPCAHCLTLESNLPSMSFCFLIFKMGLRSILVRSKQDNVPATGYRIIPSTRPCDQHFMCT